MDIYLQKRHPASPYPLPVPRVRSGFTLIEILLVVAILATMTGIMIPRLNMAYKNLELQAATARLEETVRYAAQRSVRKRQRITLSIGPDSNSYWLRGPEPMGRPAFEENPVPQRVKETQLPKGMLAELNPADANAQAQPEQGSGETIRPVQLVQAERSQTLITFFPDGRRDTSILKITDARGRSKWISVGRTLGSIEILNESPQESDAA